MQVLRLRPARCPVNAGTDWQAIANAIDAMVTALNGPKRALVAAGWDERNAERVVIAGIEPVSYTHLTLPTNREV